MSAPLARLRAEMHSELVERIFPFWRTAAADEARGGLVGLVDADGTRHSDAPKGAVLHARALWTFSAAGDRAGADALAAHFTRAFIDAEHGGAYWMIAPDGAPIDDRKHVYAQAFAIYAFVEHARATGSASSLAQAAALFELVDRHARDAERGGYREAFSRDWHPLADARLDPTDLDAPRSANTHLHLLEAYTTLRHAWPDARVTERLRELVTLFLDRVVDAGRGATFPFFDEAWTPLSRDVSFGHDIETAWLLVAAAESLGDATLVARAERAAVGLAESVLAHGWDAEHGGVYHARRADGALADEKQWWPQAEAIVGFLEAHRLTREARFADAAVGTWDFVRAHLRAPGGEWHRAVSRDGRTVLHGELAGPWKCPYHTARACMEADRRVALLAENAP